MRIQGKPEVCSGSRRFIAGTLSIRSARGSLVGSNRDSQHVDQVRDTMKRKCTQDRTWFSALSALCTSDRMSLPPFGALYSGRRCARSRAWLPAERTFYVLLQIQLR